MSDISPTILRKIKIDSSFKQELINEVSNLALNNTKQEFIKTVPGFNTSKWENYINEDGTIKNEDS